MNNSNAASVRGILVPLTSTLRQFAFVAYNPESDTFASPQVSNLINKFQVRLNLLIDVLTTHIDEAFGDYASDYVSQLHETFDEISALCTESQRSFLHLNMAHIYYLLNQVGGSYIFHLDENYFPLEWNGVNKLCKR